MTQHIPPSKHSPVEQIRIIARAVNDRRLSRLLSPAGSACFGAIAIARGRSRARLAICEGANPDCRPAMEAALRRTIQFVAFDRELMERTINDVINKGRPVNLATFRSPDFLTDPARAQALIVEKRDAFEKSSPDLAPAELALLEVRLTNELCGLDARGKKGYVQGATDIPFKVLPEGPVLLRDSPVPEEARLLASVDMVLVGQHRGTSWMAMEVEELPLVLHPTEMQLVELSADGVLSFYVYDTTHRVAPGEKRTFSCEYYFLHMGLRYRRELTLEVLHYGIYPRSKLPMSTASKVLDADDIGRIFGLSPGEG
jgi:hypothetical protein